MKKVIRSFSTEIARKTQKTSMIFPRKYHLKVDQTSLDKTLTVLISSTEPTALCTFCDTASTHIIVAITVD